MVAVNAKRVEVMLAEIDEFKASLGTLPQAKKTGKNMDYGPYIRLVSGLSAKVLLVLVLGSCFLFWVIRKGIRLARR